MTSRIAALSLTFCLALPLAYPAQAQEFAPLQPINPAELDPAMLKDLYGTWEIRDARGRRRCRVVLKKAATIGGSELSFAAGCAKTFPVLGNITAWRLLEGFAIDLVDALRHTRIRFTTPDDLYIADPETDGISTIVKL